MTESDEHLGLRREITERVKILHSLLGQATGLLMVSVIFGYYLFVGGLPFEQIETFLLFLPIIFACLAFNYQANQMTMETVSYYLCDQFPEAGGKWEKYYGDRKRAVQLISFLKTLPLFLPLLLPIVLIAWHGAWPTAVFNQVLTSIDLALFALVLFNFRYKISR